MDESTSKSYTKSFLLPQGDDQGRVDLPLIQAARLLREISNRVEKGDDRRSCLRYSLVTPIAFFHTDEQFHTFGELRYGVVHNISKNGVGFLAVTPLQPSAKIVLKLNVRDQCMHFGAEVVRCRQVLSHYDIGARLVKRLSGERVDSVMPAGQPQPEPTSYSGNSVVDK
ncbi:MAG: hypothetical protein KatS3mg110_3976 [Pirellulaceae bacterium]|nr:MAG: hypothetical protein KatS3mg110_3976 [Pirellulaceae bacterium]